LPTFGTVSTEMKHTQVIYVEEENAIITVTVYVFYGEWKD
jgi:hypothetical protein